MTAAQPISRVTSEAELESNVQACRLMRRNELFSILRIFFVLCIVGYHFAPDGLRAKIWLFSTGQSCVTFFFVLSGFVTHTAAKIRWNGTHHFYRKKLLALGPLYYATLLLCIAIEIKNARLPIGVMAADLALVQAWIPGQQMGLNPPAWFMSALVFCILVYPLLRNLAKDRPIRFFFSFAAAYWIFVQVATMILDAWGMHPVPLYWMYFPPFHLASFVIGIAAREWCDRRMACPPTTPHAIGRLLVSMATLTICLKLVEYAPAALRQAGYTTLFALPFAWLVFSVATLPTNVVSALDRPWCRAIGEITFPVYLLLMSP